MYREVFVLLSSLNCTASSVDIWQEDRKIEAIDRLKYTELMKEQLWLSKRKSLTPINVKLGVECGLDLTGLSPTTGVTYYFFHFQKNKLS